MGFPAAWRCCRSDDQGPHLNNPIQKAPATIVSLRHGQTSFRRSIVGLTAVEFPPTLSEEGGDRCVLIQDLIPAGALGAGAFEYRIDVRERGGAESKSGKRFHVEATDTIDLTSNRR